MFYFSELSFIIGPWTNFSWQDKPWAKFSTLEVAASHDMQLVYSIAIRPNLELKTQPKQLVCYLLLDIDWTLNFLNWIYFNLTLPILTLLIWVIFIIVSKLGTVPHPCTPCKKKLNYICNKAQQELVSLVKFLMKGLFCNWSFPSTTW